MTEKRSGRVRRRWTSRAAWLAGGLLAVALAAFTLFVHPFLAVTQRVDADVLVVEGWIYDYMMPPAAAEFKRGGYTLLLTSGLVDPATGDSAAARTAVRLEMQGVPRSALVSCPAAFARWSRTAKTAQAVRDKLNQLGLHPRGINVISAGPHARETWVAYQHVFGRATPVGIISIPKTTYSADRWWASRQGLIWVPKDFLGWLKEVVFGLRP